MRTVTNATIVGGEQLNPEQELEQRLALSTPKDTARGMFFNGVLGVVRTLGDENAVEQCLRVSEERHFVDFFNYPISTFLKLTCTAARLLAPQCGGFEGALWRMGQQATKDFLASATGKALLLLGGSNARQMLNNLQSGFQAAVSYGERTVEWTGPKSGRFIMKRDFMPCPYHEGVLYALLETLGAKDVQVRGWRTGPLDSQYELSWK